MSVPCGHPANTGTFVYMIAFRLPTCILKISFSTQDVMKIFLSNNKSGAIYPFRPNVYLATSTEFSFETRES